MLIFFAQSGTSHTSVWESVAVIAAIVLWSLYMWLRSVAGNVEKELRTHELLSCPNVGKKPVHSSWKPTGYVYWHKEHEGEEELIVKCHECGFTPLPQHIPAMGISADQEASVVGNPYLSLPVHP